MNCMIRIARQVTGARFSPRPGYGASRGTFASAASAQPALRTKPPSPPAHPADRDDPLDAYIADVARSLMAETTRGPSLFAQSQQNSGISLDASIPYEAYPSAARRADSHPGESVGTAASGQGDGLVLVVHAVLLPRGEMPDFTVCSGFVVNAGDPGQSGRQLVITCAHTLLEIEQMHPGKHTVSFIITPSASNQSAPLVLPIRGIPASMPRSDVLVCDVPASPVLRSLPLSPFPMYRGQPLLMHFFGSPEPPDPAISPIVAARHARADTDIAPTPRDPIGWPVAGLGWRRWVSGEMLGYRNGQWQEVEPGTSSALRFILASPLPTPGSSGGPIVDATSGSVVGLISGRRMDNRIEGERGWGVTAERIFDMFAIPGFVPASKKHK